MKKEFLFLSQSQRDAGMEERNFKVAKKLFAGCISKCALCRKGTFGFTCPKCTKKLQQGYGHRKYEKRKLREMN